jgi:RNA polymerase sigma-70 factor (ECF subfamily)
VATQPAPAILERLVDNHRRFLRFLERRVGSREEAEEILQAAFAKGVERAGSIREGESAVAWFYRLLRNALVDHYRREAVRDRALHRIATPEAGDDPELAGAICECLGHLLPTLKKEYADVLRALDLEGGSLEKFARSAGITANNATVRLHRARRALRRRLEESCGTCAEHACLDCSCRSGR